MAESTLTAPRSAAAREIGHKNTPPSAWEAGCLIALIESDPMGREGLPAVRRQLIDISKKIDQECGIKKTILANGQILIRDRNGLGLIQRDPYPWEVVRPRT